MIAERGTLSLTLVGVLDRDGKTHDLVVAIRRERGAWESRADGLARTFNAPDHPVRVQMTDPGDGGLRIGIRADIHPDPWILGGSGTWTVDLSPQGDGWTGAWSGAFTPARRPAIPGSGPARAVFMPPFTVTGMRPAEPAILDEWRSRGPAGLLGDWTRCGDTGDGGDPGWDQPVVRAVDHGVRPDSGLDATAPLQAAIDACARQGGGVVELPPGRLEVALDHDDALLTIRHDRVRLRGAGSGPDGTLIYAHRPGRADDPRRMWRAGQWPRLLHIGPRSPRDEEDHPAPDPIAARIAGESARGDRALGLESGHDLKPGIHRLDLHETEDLALGDRLTAPSGRRGTNWRKPGRAMVSHYVRVIAVEGDRAVLDHPLPAAVEPRWTPVLRTPRLLHGNGVRGLRFATAWDEVFDHHRSDVHDNGWDGIRCDRVAGLELADIVFESVTTAASLKDAFASRFTGLAIHGNPGHNGFGLGGASTRCLIHRCRFGRAMHAVNMNGTIAQNAIVDCEGDEPCGIDFHGSLGLDTLFDRLAGCVCTGGGAAENVPPRHGPGLVLWNWRCGTFHPYKANHALTCIADAREMPGFIAVGVHGRRPLHALDHDGNRIGEGHGPWGRIEHLDRPTTPGSLWAWQRGQSAPG